MRGFGWAVRSSRVTARPCASSQPSYRPGDDETQLDADPIISIYLAVIIIGLLMSMAITVSLMLLGLSAVIPVLNSLMSGALDKM